MSLDFNQNSSVIGRDDNVIRIPLAAGEAFSGTEISGLLMDYQLNAAQGMFDNSSVILDENGSAEVTFTMTSRKDSTKQELYIIYFYSVEKQSDFNIKYSSTNKYYTFSETLMKSDFTYNEQNKRYETTIELPMIIALGQDISFRTTSKDVTGLPDLVKIVRGNGGEPGSTSRDSAQAGFTYEGEKYNFALVRTNLDFAGIDILKYEINHVIRQINFNKSEIKIGEHDNITYIELPNDLPKGTDIALNAIIHHDLAIATYEFEEPAIALDSNGKATAKLTITSVENPIKQEVYIFKFQSNMSDDIKVASVSILNSETTMEVGASINLKAQVLPVNASNQSVIWSVSNTQVAKIEDNEKLIAKAPGNIQITVKSLENDTIYCSKTIHVINKLGEDTKPDQDTKPIEENKPIVNNEPTLVKLNKASVKLKKNKTFTIKPIVSPISAKGQIKYKSSDTKIATVSKQGKIKGIAGGNATITATLGKSALRVKVTVLDPVKKIKVKKLTLKIKRGKKQKIKVSTVPKRTSDKITYKSKNIKIARVNKSGVVSAKKKGDTTITVRAASGKKVNVKIKVI